MLFLKEISRLLPERPEIKLRASELNQKIIESLPIILEYFPKASIYKYGSLARRELHNRGWSKKNYYRKNFDENSDADLFIDTPAKFSNIAQAKEFKTNVKKQITETVGDGIDISFLDELEPELRQLFLDEVSPDFIPLIDQEK